MQPFSLTFSIEMFEPSKGMKLQFTLLLLLTLIAKCSRQDSYDSINHTDLTEKVSAYETLEKQIWDYYLSVEEDVKMDLGVSEADIVERVQLLVDDGHVKRPVILVITEDGLRWKSVAYHTYKEYMRSNAVASRRFHGMQPDVLDTVSMDSIRSNLLKTLKLDSINKN